MELQVTKATLSFHGDLLDGVCITFAILYVLDGRNTVFDKLNLLDGEHTVFDILCWTVGILCLIYCICWRVGSFSEWSFSRCFLSDSGREQETVI